MTSYSRFDDVNQRGHVVGSWLEDGSWGLGVFAPDSSKFRVLTAFLQCIVDAHKRFYQMNVLLIVAISIGALHAGAQRGVEHLLPNASHDLYQGLWLANGHILQVFACVVHIVTYSDMLAIPQLVRPCACLKSLLMQMMFCWFAC